MVQEAEVGVDCAEKPLWVVAMVQVVPPLLLLLLVVAEVVDRLAPQVFEVGVGADVAAAADGAHVKVDRRLEVTNAPWSGRGWGC